VTGNSAAEEEAHQFFFFFLQGSHSGEDADGAGVESDGEKKGHDEGMPEVECMVYMLPSSEA
jgi:hypothetical protein